MPERNLILEREGAAKVKMSITNFRRWAGGHNIMPIDISAPGAKKRSLRYYEDEIETVITVATERRDKEQGELTCILRFERKAR